MIEPPRRALLRILDANRNRALEALRVVEEHARFVLSSERLATRAKDLRHAVQLALAPWSSELVACRDVANDPLRPAEKPRREEGPRAARASGADVLGANLQRAKEALRALEEYAKPLATEGALASARELERARYGVYELEAALSAPTRALLAHEVYVLVEGSPSRPPVGEQTRLAIRGGARLVQLREKRLEDGARLAQAREVAKVAHGEGALLVVNDRPDIAALCEADGLHVGQTDLPADEARRLLPPGTFLGSSAHDRPELERSLAQRVDYVGIGTVFPSRTKPELGHRGIDVLRELAPRAGLPVFAIGGITPANAASAIDAGATGVAVSSAVLDAPRIDDAVRELVRVVREARARRGS